VYSAENNQDIREIPMMTFSAMMLLTGQQKGHLASNRLQLS